MGQVCIDPLSHRYTHNPPDLLTDRSERFLTDPDGHAFVHRYEDVAALASDPRMRRSPADETYASTVKEAFPALHWMLINSPMEDTSFHDPDVHVKLIRFLSVAFSRKAVRKWETSIEIRARHAVEILARSEGEVDLYQIFRTYPLAVAFDLLGIAQDDEGVSEFQNLFCDFLSAYSASYSPRTDLAYVAERADTANQGIERARSVFADWLVDFEKDPSERGSYLTDLHQAWIQSGLSRDQLLAGMISILAGSSDTVAVTAALMARLLLRHPAEFDALREAAAADESVLETATWELIRLDNASQGIMRFPRHDFEYGGRLLEKDRLVFLSNQLANLDPNEFSNPLRLDFRRANAVRTLAFGVGRRACPGRALAHLELREVLRGLLRVLPSDTRLLSEGPGSEERVWQPLHYVVRFMREMRVEIPPRDAP